MFTRRHVRAALIWSGIAIGAMGALGYASSLLWSVSYDAGDSVYFAGRGAMVVQYGFPMQLQNGGRMGPRPVGGWSVEPAGLRPWRWLPHNIDPERATGTSGATPGLFVIPFWVPLLIGLASIYALLPPGSPPARKPRCPRCRFDLAGAPPVDLKRTHVQCPECGTVCDRDEITHNEKPPARAGGLG